MGNSADSKIILITGASSGIGAATARRLAADGHHVVLGARRVDRLAALVDELRAAGGSADYHELDVTSRDSVLSFVERAHDRHGHIDVLVNNAGVMALSALDTLRVDEWDQMVEVNLRGTMYGIAAALPLMRARGTGHIVNIGSTAAYRVDPTAAIYCATKYAVRALTEGLRQESRDVRVTLVSPGYTHSELTERGGDPQVRAAARAAAEELGMPASAVADAIAFAIAQPDSVDVNEIIVRSTVQG
ncbi:MULTISPECIES: SDR family oxidoreductase [Micromonospora]|uniref:SDR family oxidoreductase n=1 Tax=Micromonospora solifontis TaxID=2487138 RepID=A0ABX9WB37_9ACTN|nr:MULTISPECIES: SDR family oxidoreductase [Micromonospora]NES17083.1 SDR family oxidoreductase [Micromonospora sp. PPF5-17B]NES39570.1 SDR family oxidoreductase [Micromonospora solifontis]NES57089.1 SDR family oxidoreductase [Micromonospora sp. PPF5-6]RNL88170.1 SDR family oxidoreductase [Micromonospora solifontis]